jgi:hypothetical protein
MFLACLAMPSIAQRQINFVITDGLANQQLKTRMEANISRFLSELSCAGAENRSLQLDGVRITDNAVHSLSLLWQNLHFVCVDNEIQEHCNTTVNGYQLRNIAIKVIPVIEDYDGDLDRQLTISLSRTGEITGARMAMASHVYTNIIKNGDAVDMARREEILKFVEDFRSHYDEKDIEALNQVFSDDALIITGSVVMKRDNQGDRPQMRPEIIYRTQNKQQYLSRLKQTFRNNKYIKVTFSDPEVVRSKKNPNFFGVTLHQHWKSDRYEDDGYVFLLWEFHENDEPPIIHVRTWQPDKIADAPLPQDKIINILDFEIPPKKRTY